MADANNDLRLPIQVTSRAEVSRLIREIDEIGSFMEQAAIRRSGSAMHLPRTSRLLDEMAASSELNLLVAKDRGELMGFLVSVKSKAPVLHIGLGVDPSPVFVQKLLTWLRKEIHPVLLLHIGLQPSIGAGCTVRGNSLYLDLSLRKHFHGQRALLISRLRDDIDGLQAAKSVASPSQAGGRM